MSKDQKYEFKVKKEEGKEYIFDIIRKKYVRLYPEEWVRQRFVHRLIYDYGIPRTMISVEKELSLNTLRKRSDIVVYASSGKPAMLIECKSPGVALKQKAFDQAGRYNLRLRVQYLIIANGKQTFCAKLDFRKQEFAFLNDIPDWGELKDPDPDDQGNTPNAM